MLFDICCSVLFSIGGAVTFCDWIKMLADVCDWIKMLAVAVICSYFSSDDYQ